MKYYHTIQLYKLKSFSISRLLLKWIHLKSDTLSYHTSDEFKVSSGEPPRFVSMPSAFFDLY
jgi:hypothetical protein